MLCMAMVVCIGLHGEGLFESSEQGRQGVRQVQLDREIHDLQLNLDHHTHPPRPYPASSPFYFPFKFSTEKKNAHTYSAAMPYHRPAAYSHMSEYMSERARRRTEVFQMRGRKKYEQIDITN